VDQDRVREIEIKLQEVETQIRELNKSRGGKKLKELQELEEREARLNAELGKSFDS